MILTAIAVQFIANGFRSFGLRPNGRARLGGQTSAGPWSKAQFYEFVFEPKFVYVIRRRSEHPTTLSQRLI